MADKENEAVAAYSGEFMSTVMLIGYWSLVRPVTNSNPNSNLTGLNCYASAADLSDQWPVPMMMYKVLSYWLCLPLMFFWESYDNLKPYWKHICLTRPRRLVTFIYRRLRNILTYLFTYNRLNIFGSAAAGPISLPVVILSFLFFFLLGATVFKKAKAPSFQIGSGWTLA